MRRLGGGGYGDIWKAHDTHLGREVAVKVMRLQDGLSDDERTQLRRRAEREAKNATRLREHPCIITTYDVVVEDGLPMIIMRLVDGHSLEERLRRQGRLSAEETLTVARALLRALDAAHKQGILHRDVKHANVMLSKEGEILLGDFGLSVHPTDISITPFGQLIGTPEFRGPERRAGENDNPASDLFALGVTLYQCAQGTLPPSGQAAVLNWETPRSPDADLLTVLITGLLQEDPRNRPTAAEALQLISGPPLPARPCKRNIQGLPPLIGHPALPPEDAVANIGDVRQRGLPRNLSMLALLAAAAATVLAFAAVMFLEPGMPGTEPFPRDRCWRDTTVPHAVGPTDHRAGHPGRQPSALTDHAGVTGGRGHDEAHLLSRPVGRARRP